MRAHGAHQSQRRDSRVEVTNETPSRASREIGIDGIKNRPQMLAEHLVCPRQLKARNIQEPHQFWLLRHVLHHKGGQHRHDHIRIKVGRQAVLQLPAKLQAIQSGFGRGPEKVLLPGKVTEQGCFVDTGEIGYIARAGALEALPGKQLHSGLDKAHFGNAAFCPSFHEVTLRGGFRGTGAHTLTGSISCSPISTATLCMMRSRVRTTRSWLFLRTSTPTMPANAPE